MKSLKITLIILGICLLLIGCRDYAGSRDIEIYPGVSEISSATQDSSQSPQPTTEELPKEIITSKNTDILDEAALPSYEYPIETIFGKWRIVEVIPYLGTKASMRDLFVAEDYIGYIVEYQQNKCIFNEIEAEIKEYIPYLTNLYDLSQNVGGHFDVLFDYNIESIEAIQRGNAYLTYGAVSFVTDINFNANRESPYVIMSGFTILSEDYILLNTFEKTVLAKRIEDVN